MDNYILQSKVIRDDLIKNYSVAGCSSLIYNPIVIPDKRITAIKKQYSSFICW
jgi:hypothetical protein